MIKGKYFGIVLLTVLLLGFLYTPEAYAYGDLPQELPGKVKPLKGITIQKGSFLRITLMQTVSSEFNKTDDVVKAVTLSDFFILNNVAIPQKSIFVGHIPDLKKAEQGRDGYFFVDFDSILFPDGSSTDVKAHLYVSGGGKMVGGALSPRIGYKTTMFRVASFGTKGVMQLQPNGPRVMGKETKIPAGSEILIELDEALKL